MDIVLPSDDEDGRPLSMEIELPTDVDTDEEQASGSVVATAKRPRCRRLAAARPRKNGVNPQAKGNTFEFKNVAPDGRVSEVPLPPLPIARSSLMVLELFSGTGSVGDVFAAANHRVSASTSRTKGGASPRTRRTSWNGTTNQHIYRTHSKSCGPLRLASTTRGHAQRPRRRVILNITTPSWQKH